MQPKTSIALSFSMSEYNCHEHLVQLERFIDSNIYQDAPNTNSSNHPRQDDCLQNQNFPGLQTESQPRAYHDHQVYNQLARQNLADLPSALSSWPGAQPSGLSFFARNDHEPEYSNYFSVFPSDAREFGWTEFGWSEHPLDSTVDRTMPYPQAHSFEGYSMGPTESSYSLGLSNSQESSTPKISQCEIFSEDEGFFSDAMQGSSPRAFHFGHIHEPVPLNAARSSLLSECIDTFLPSFQPLPDARPSVASQDAFYENQGPLSQSLETSVPHHSSLGPYASAWNRSPLDTGSLPDLSRSRRQTPRSGPLGVPNAQRPMTPCGSAVKYDHANCKCSDHQPTESPGALNHCLSNSDEFPYLPSTKSSISRYPSCGTSIESTTHATEDRRILSLDSRRSLCNILSAISVPSPPQLFANTPISRINSYAHPSALKLSALLPPITDTHLQARQDETEPPAAESQSGKESKRNSTRSKTDRPKRKRMHICNLCGKDFNRPSALLLHATVHTGERSNICNICGRSFSNLSNLRRHQRQLHVLESQVRLPEIPGPISEIDAYNFGSQTRF